MKPLDRAATIQALRRWVADREICKTERRSSIMFSFEEQQQLLNDAIALLVVDVLLHGTKAASEGGA
jgi:hypothetical protein